MKINIEGNASIDLNSILVVCGHCNHHEKENALIEFNARDNKVLFSCVKCKKMNVISFGLAPHEAVTPIPRTRM